MTDPIPKAHNEYYYNTVTIFFGGFGVENPHHVEPSDAWYGICAFFFSEAPNL